MTNVSKLLSLICILISAEIFFPESSWAGCGPPQCPWIRHETVEVAITHDHCMTVGLYLGDVVKQAGENEANIFPSMPNVISGNSRYTPSTGVCKYYYSIQEY